ncbi:MAG: endonuclease/exonuclease/phosphatase family protein [Dehalococcoidia bacterium]
MRLITFNTAKSEPPYSLRLEWIAEALASLRPDIVLLQEALLSEDGRFNTAAWLATALKMDHRSFAVRYKLRPVAHEALWTWSSPAVLARWPISQIRPIPLPWQETDGERMALGALVETPVGPLRLVNAHLSHLPSSGLRRAQIATILASRWLAGPAVARVIGGDLNATPDSPELADLLGEKNGWIVEDAYATAGGAPSGTAFDYQSGRPTGRRIDHVLMVRRPDEAAARVVGAQIVLDHLVANRHLSDHFGVLVTIDLPDSGAQGL